LDLVVLAREEEAMNIKLRCLLWLATWAELAESLVVILSFTFVRPSFAARVRESVAARFHEAASVERDVKALKALRMITEEAEEFLTKVDAKRDTSSHGGGRP
jgi:hypothetical protein